MTQQVATDLRRKEKCHGVLLFLPIQRHLEELLHWLCGLLQPLQGRPEAG